MNTTHLVLHFDYFARKLEGTLTPESFTGTFGTATGTPIPVELHPAVKEHEASPSGPSINGDWEIAVKSPKGESAWTMRVSPSGSQTRLGPGPRLQGQVPAVGSFPGKER